MHERSISRRSALLLIGAASLIGCSRYELCDRDRDGLCAPVDCDDHDPRVGDCSVTAGTPAPGTEVPGDDDRDGWTAQDGDCDDADAEVYPGHAEVCDAKDNDCDGDVDEGLTSTWYADDDADGHGDGASPAQGCTAPVGHVASGDDCDDADPEVYPGHPEVCDAKDNDCDGRVPSCWGSATWGVGWW